MGRRCADNLFGRFHQITYFGDIGSIMSDLESDLTRLLSNIISAINFRSKQRCGDCILYGYKDSSTQTIIYNDRFKN